MESFEAILRNLEQAQRRGLETVTNRLEFVIESLQELINEATTSVREASPADAEELFPIAEIRSAVEAAKARAAEFANRVEELEHRAEGAEAAPAAGPSLSVLRTLDAARSQSELLRELLTILAESVGRAVVLVLRDGRISAWSGIGLADAERLRLWSGDAAASTALERLMARSVCCRFDPSVDPVFSTWLAGEPQADEALLVPFVLRDRLVGAVYVDRVEGSPWAPDVVQSMIAVACWLIDTLPYRQTTPFPSLSEVEALDEEATAAAEPEEEAPEVSEEPEAELGQEPEPAPEEEHVVEADVESPAEDAAPEEEEPPSYDPSSTVRIELPTAVPEVTPAAEAAEEEVPAQEETPTPPPVQPVTPPPVEEEAQAVGEDEAEAEDEDIPAEQQPLHEEARRFARLLVSEIKLYNEEDVEQGRANKDIYQRLKDDIDRSREMYDARVAAEVREVRDYFEEELVRILGDGDPDTLGM